MSLINGVRGSLITFVFDLSPHDDDFWPIWEQIVAAENGWTK